MKREFLTTGDGSVTIHLSDWNESYHSRRGAIAESRHVFIQAGLNHLLKNSLSNSVCILEIGFGTGLNAYLTLLETIKNHYEIAYTGVDAFPITLSEVQKLNYPELLDASETEFLKLHQTPWEKWAKITSEFTLQKRKQFFLDITDEEEYDLVYFDAFGANVQPELWTETIFHAMYTALKPGGFLVTYAAKGSVRRAMQSIGFTVERLPGPPGKREMLRARKD